MEKTAVQNSELISRYPGSQPFTRAYRSLFCGRQTDIVELVKVVNINKLTVLYSRSGYGKSSLLNAGVVPDIEEKQGYESFFVRFQSFNREQPKTLRGIFSETIAKKIKELSAEKAKNTGGSVFLSDVQNADLSLWQEFKQLEWLYRERKGLLLVLDQFEEIFTYAEHENIEDFARELSELVYNRMPNDFQKRLYEIVGADAAFVERENERLNFIENPIPVRILMGIRSDKMSLLDRLSGFVPTILKNCYELKPLSNQQAEEAIVKPADEIGDFRSPRFGYEAAAVKATLNYLTQNGTKPVESFQLQIICQHFEREIQRVFLQQNVLKNIENPPLSIKAEQAENLAEVIRDYYQNTLTGNDDATDAPRFSPMERLMVRYLLEKRLIDGRNRCRISLDSTLVEQMGIGDDTIEKLVDSRLIRREPNTVSGLSYELSHDTLIDPIFQAATDGKLGDLDVFAENFYHEAADKIPFPMRQNALDLNETLLDFSGRTLEKTPEELGNKTLVEQLMAAEIIQFNKKKGVFELNYVFQNAVRAQRSARQKLETQQKEAEVKTAQAETERERKTRQRVQIFAIVASAMTLAAVVLVIWSFYQNNLLQKATRQTELAMTELSKKQKEVEALTEKETVKDLADRATNLLARGYPAYALELFTQAKMSVDKFPSDSTMQIWQPILEKNIRECQSKLPK